MTGDSEFLSVGGIEPEAEAPAPEEPKRPEPTVLARGHLHPAILLLRLVDALRQAVFPALLGIVMSQPWFLILAGVLFLLALGYSLARYLTLDYRLTTDELRIREGLLHRQERRIPLDRIQDLGFESTILRRALGITVVLVETASGRGVEARLDALGRSDADHLREVLLAARDEATRRDEPVEEIAEDGTPTPREPDPEWTVHRSTTGELLVRGLTDLRLSAFAVTGYAAFELADQLGFLTEVAGVASSIRNWLLGFPPLVLALVLISVLVGVVAIGVVTATVGNLVQFHGFHLTLAGSVLHRRYGLLTTRQKTLPRDRIQRVTVEQPWLRRLCGYAVVKADSAGGSRAQGEDASGGWDVVVPLLRHERAMALLPALLPGFERIQLGWRGSSPLLVVRTTLQGVVLAAILTAVLAPKVEFWSLLGLLPIPIWALLGVLAYRNLAFALDDEFLALQHGIIGRYAAYLPTRKVQSVVVRQSPIAQLLGLAELTVHVAGGSPTRLPDLTIGDAHELRAQLAALAAAAAATE